jgi:hypothetical protein
MLLVLVIFLLPVLLKLLVVLVCFVIPIRLLLSEVTREENQKFWVFVEKILEVLPV